MRALPGRPGPRDSVKDGTVWTHLPEEAPIAIEGLLDNGSLGQKELVPCLLV